MEEILTEMGLGFFCENDDEVYAQLKYMIEEYINTGKINVSGNLGDIMKYSRRNQTKKVASLLANL